MKYSDRDGDHLWPAEGQPRSAWIALCERCGEKCLELGAWHIGRSNLGNIPAVYGYFEDKKVAVLAKRQMRKLGRMDQLRIEYEEGLDSYTLVIYPSRVEDE